MEPSSWQAILALTINTAGVAVALRFSQRLVPALESRVPWMMPALAAAYGPILMQVQAWLSDKLGVAIDLSPLYAVTSGATAFLFHAQRARVLATGGKWMAQGKQGLKFGLAALFLPLAIVGCAPEGGCKSTITGNDNVVTQGCGGSGEDSSATVPPPAVVPPVVIVPPVFTPEGQPVEPQALRRNE